MVGYESAKTADRGRLADLIAGGLPWEAIPTDALADASTWRALLPVMPMGALVRNLGRATANGAIVPLSREAETVAARLRDQTAIRKARLHPLALLVALRTYAQGRGEKGRLTWEPAAEVVAALDDAFYLAFGNVEPTGKRTLLALDVSGSMTSGGICGSSLTPREGSAALALLAARTEPRHHIVGFTSAGAGGWTAPAQQGRWSSMFGSGNGISPLPIGARDRLDDAVRKVGSLPFGATDCALPMLYALERGVEADAFAIFTDSETFAGVPHPVEALRMYRARTGIAAKLIVVGMVANQFSISDPNDGGCLDVVGFDLATPGLMADFIRQ